MNEPLMEEKTFEFEIKQVTEEGQLEGYASTFNNKDRGDDIVEPGAFTKTIAAAEKKGRLPKMLDHHNLREPVGAWDFFKEDRKGLFAQGHLVLAVQRAKELHALLQEKVMDGLSIGFKAVKFMIDEKSGVRRLMEVDLFEVSIVTLGMNPKALVTGVKGYEGMIENVREFESFLREVGGFSRKEAKLLTGHGFKELLVQRDAGEENLSGLLDSLTRLSTTIRE
jgi:HK97 family phage prohead protease